MIDHDAKLVLILISSSCCNDLLCIFCSSNFFKLSERCSKKHENSKEFLKLSNVKFLQLLIINNVYFTLISSIYFVYFKEFFLEDKFLLLDISSILHLSLRFLIFFLIIFFLERRSSLCLRQCVAISHPPLDN